MKILGECTTINYDPRNCFHQRLRDMRQHEWQEALKLIDGPLIIGGRKVTQKEFREMMGTK